MVRDNVTGLIWENKTDDGSIHDKSNRYDWSGARSDFIASLNTANFGGYSDWRLPTIKELMSIVDNDRHSPSVNITYFPNTMFSHSYPYTTYWSYTSDRGSPGWGAWSVNFSFGYTTVDDKSDEEYVRAVRGGQCGSFGNYIDNGDGTVTDTDTGLMWQQDTAPDYYNWQQALSYCENLTLAGYSDWRLPNVHELQSLVAYLRIDPSIETGFFNTVSFFYWTSTTDVYHLDNVWGVSFYSGDVGFPDKSNDEGNVRAVRGGQCGSFGDLDDDCRIDCIDNCPSTLNGLDLGTCTKGTIAQPCTSDGECGSGGLCSMQNEDTDRDFFGDVCDNCPNINNPTQQDFYPPQGNGIGDACDCESDFDCDGDVDGTDAQSFKLYFGRNLLAIPCDEVNPCRGDFDCDQDCDGTDASLFKLDFGRSQFNDPCPVCEVGEWCVYP